MIFEPQIARKPDHYSTFAQPFIDAMWAGFWTPNEFNFQSDLHQFRTEMTDQERQMVVRALSAIAQIEVAVKTFWSRLGDNLPHPGISDLGHWMAAVEVIHNKAYEKLLDVLDLNDVFAENLKLDIIRGRVDYLRKHLDKVYEDDKKQYVYSLILFTLFVENVSLFSQFYVVMWMNRFRNVLKDTAQQIQYTAKEENIHALVGVGLINIIRNEYPELFTLDLMNTVHAQALKAWECECQIIDWMVGDFEEENLSAPILKEYVWKRITDSLKQISLVQQDLRIPVNQELIDKTVWMDEEVLGNGHTDFFHKKSINYTKKSAAFTEDDLF